jgi:phenylalanyl-tRNA synthetase beta subunit
MTVTSMTDIRKAADAVQRMIDIAIATERARCLEIIQASFNEAADNRVAITEIAKIKARVLAG